MEQINEILSQLHKILKCKMALLAEDKLYFYPEGNVMPYEEQILQGYNSVNIQLPKGRMAFYTEAGAEIDEKALELAALHIKSQLCASSSLDSSIIRLLKGDYEFADIAAIKSLLDSKEDIYLIVVSGIDITDTEAELIEIIKNSADVRLISKYQGNIVALIAEEDINEACSEMQRNLLTEIYVDSLISIGGKLEQPQQLAKLYNNCVEALLLRQRYGINQKLLNYQNMLVYRLIASLDQKLKEEIVERVFSSSFTEVFNSEMELTIEEMLKNNLNITDTSARLYIHRNTLIYRIDKIHKLTGFDLRKFEDSMIFKLAWLIYKEKIKK